MLNPKRREAEHRSVKELNGPSVDGTGLQNGESRRVGPGDVVVIPAGVGHYFSSIDGRFATRWYASIRTKSSHSGGFTN